MIKYGEFLVWKGMWFMMITIQGLQQHDFDRISTVDNFRTYLNRFNGTMPWTLIEEILKVLDFTKKTTIIQGYILRGNEYD